MADNRPTMRRASSMKGKESSSSAHLHAGRKSRSLEIGGKALHVTFKEDITRCKSWSSSSNGLDWKAQLASANMILALSPTSNPMRTLAAIQFMAKVYQVGAEGSSIAGLMPDAWKAYIKGSSGTERSLPLQTLVDTVARWAAECNRMCRPGMTSKDDTRLFRLANPVIEALNLQVLNSTEKGLSLITGQDLVNAIKDLPKHTQDSNKSMKRSFWDSPSQTGLQTTPIVTAHKDMEDQIVKGSMCLSSGRWVFSIKLKSLSTQPAWIGLCDASSSVASLEGQDEISYMFGTNGLLRISDNGDASTRCLSLPVKRGNGEVTIKVHLDMNAHTCGFSANGKFLGTVFQRLPQFVRPAISLPLGGVAEFVYMDAS